MENLDTRVAESLASGKKIIDEVAYDLLAKEIIALIKTKAESSHTHSADQVTETDSKKFVSPHANGAVRPGSCTNIGDSLAGCHDLYV